MSWQALRLEADFRLVVSSAEVVLRSFLMWSNFLALHAPNKVAALVITSSCTSYHELDSTLAGSLYRREDPRCCNADAQTKVIRQQHLGRPLRTTSFAGLEALLANGKPAMAKMARCS